MINEQLLKIIVCPVNRQPLQIADRQLVDKVNQAINSGRVKDRAGRPVIEAIQEGLVRQDGQVLYPVRDGIPVLLAEDGIPLDTI
jgi:uncharacterized protein YbaR (Trm112 family)